MKTLFCDRAILGDRERSYVSVILAIRLAIVSGHMETRLKYCFVSSSLSGSIMEIMLIILMLSVAMAEGQHDCVGPIPADEKEVRCSYKNVTTVPILHAEVEEV